MATESRPVNLPLLWLPPVVVSIALLAGQLAFGGVTAAATRLGSELLFFAAAALWLRAGSGFFRSRPLNPLRILLAPLLLVLLVFLLFIGLNGLAVAVPARAGVSPAGAWMALFPIALCPLLALLLASFRALHAVKRSRARSWEWTGLLLLLAVAYFTARLPGLPRFANGLILFFTVVAMLLNSFRVKWIAFLSKKQKRMLVYLSALFLFLAIADTVMAFGGGFLIDVLTALAPGLRQVHRLVMLYSCCGLGMILVATLFHLPTADAYEQKAREASSLMDLSHALTEMVDFRELADKIAAMTTSVCRADSAWLAILERDGLTVPGVYNIGHEEAVEISRIVLAEAGAGEAGLRVLRNQKIRVRMQTDVTTFAFHALVLAPLAVKNRITGYLFTAVRKESSFDEDDLPSVRAFASSAAMALENARLLDSRLEKERLLKELEIARDIQHRLLPGDPPPDSQVDMAAYFCPAYEVGGDYYDFRLLADRHLAFIIADVSGKGISAAFVMAELKGVFASLATVAGGPRELLVRGNDILKRSLEKSRFISASCGWLDLETRALRVARAGHMPFFHISGGQARKFAPAGLVLGLGHGTTFADKLEEIRLPLRAGDVLVFFTDGVSESKNLLGQDYGYDRLCSAVLANSGQGAAELAQTIVADIKAFANNPVQQDDVSLLLFKMK